MRISIPFILKPCKMVLLISLTAVLLLLFLSYWWTSPDEIRVPTISRPSVPSSYNGTIVIVGAGTAGLFAAYTLQYLGHENYQILEASDRVGGRVQESPSSWLDVPMDLGAEWIHGDPRVLADLLLYEEDRKQLPRTISYQPSQWGVFVRGRRRRRNVLRYFYREFKFYNTTWYSYLRDYVQSHIPAIKITYNATVQLIDTTIPTNATIPRQGPVRLLLSDGREVWADQVIVAAPLSMLHGTRASMQFTPDLSTVKRTAMQSVYMASGIKVWIEFNKSFYPDIQTTASFSGFNDEGPNADAVYFNSVYKKPSTRHALTYFSVGRDADELTQLDNDAIHSKLMYQLDTMFDGQASRYYVQHWIQNWAKVPHIQTGYSADWANDFEGTIEEMGRPIGTTVYFAGEHTNAPYVATVHGAAISGRKAAQDVLRDGQR